MDRKELNDINKLFERLDKCLIWNAALLGRRNPTPEMETVDALGDLFERHRYLKNEHNFLPGEAEALLGFDDPLVVAQSCWEENGFTNFPICEILDDIRAYDRFTLTPAEQERRKGPQVQQLKERLDQNLAAYTAALMEKSKAELIEDSEIITNTQAAYSYMRHGYEYTHNDAGLLLNLDDPLHYLASRWSMTFDLSGDDDDSIQEIIEELEDPANLRRAQEAAAEVCSSFTVERDDKSSLLDRLHKTEKVADQRFPQEDKSTHRSDGPNL